MGDFIRKKISCRLISMENIYLSRKYLTQKIVLHWKKKCLSCCTVVCRYMFGENPNQIIHTRPPPSPPLLKSQKDLSYVLPTPGVIQSATKLIFLFNCSKYLPTRSITSILFKVRHSLWSHTLWSNYLLTTWSWILWRCFKATLKSYMCIS